jgi:diguanylate cyclase (GGDEF)-like protein
VINSSKLLSKITALPKPLTVKKLNFTFAFLFVFMFAISAQSAALSVHPVWLQESIDKVDDLNDKNPVLAVEFAQALLKKHREKLSSSGKAALFARLAEYHYYLAESKESIKYIELYYALSPDLTSSDGISLLLTHGAVLDDQGRSKQAMELFLQAEKNAKESENRKLLAESYGFIASTLSANFNDSEALKYYHKAYLIVKDLDEGLEMAYLKIQMSNSYSYIFDNEKAIELANEAINYFNKNEYYYDELYAQNTLANNYMRMKEYDEAIIRYQKIIELSSKVEKESLIEVAYIGLTRAHHKKKQNDKARHYFNLYQQVPPSSDSPFSIIGNLMLSTEIAIAEKNIPLAQSNILEIESILLTLDKEGILGWQISLLDLKTDIAVFNQDYKGAYQLQKETRELSKSYQSIKREKARSKYKVMFDTDQALLKNQLLERDKQLDKVALENSAKQNKLQTLLTFVISLLALGLLFFIHRQRKNSKMLNKLANTDMLTELANRRYTFIYAEAMLAQAKKNKENFSAIIFDVDHFKKINDTYGHSGGDIALKEIALITNEYVRSNDILGRIGGEEFLVILPNTSSKQAYEIAERIRKAIEIKDIMLNDTVVNISASFGISNLEENQQNFNQIFHEADVALYKAKNSGRNCISLAS